MTPATAQRQGSVTSLDTVVRVSSSLNAPDKSYLISLLDEAGSYRLAASVRRCHEEYRTLSCGNGHRFKPVPTYHCNYRLCVDCARERQRRSFARLMPVLRAHQRRYRFDRPVLITLTARSTFDPLKVQDKRFKAWFTKLRRTVRWKHCIRGAVAAFEFTWDREQGWHYHIHVLAFRKVWFDQAEISSLWQRITGGAGEIVDIQSKGGLHSMAEETIKYCFKPSDLGLKGRSEKRWGVEQVVEFNELRRVKFSESYGSLRGFELDADDLEAEAEFAEVSDKKEDDLHFGSPCPDCGSPLQYETVPRSVAVMLVDST